MPIIGLTNRGCSFAQIGMIRKGAKKMSERTHKEYPVDLKYFKVDFDQMETAREELFRKVYGDKPTEINIFLPFDDLDRCWDAWYEGYTAGRMVARSDGEFFLYRVDLKTGETIVHDGLDKNGQKVKHEEYLGVAGKTEIKCKPAGRLKVLIPELQSLVYLVLTTGSVIDIRNISQQLEGIRLINNGHLVGVPLILRRRPKKVSVPKEDGTRARLEKWMISIEVDPSWVTKKLAQLTMAALPSLPSGILEGIATNTPEQEDIPEDNESDDGEIDGEWNDEGVPEQEERPMTHEELAKEIKETLAKEDKAESAETVNADAPNYGLMETKELSFRANSLMRSLEDTTLSEEDRIEKENKFKVIKKILAERADWKK